MEGEEGEGGLTFPYPCQKTGEVSANEERNGDPSKVGWHPNTHCCRHARAIPTSATVKHWCEFALLVHTVMPEDDQLVKKSTTKKTQNIQWDNFVLRDGIKQSSAISLSKSVYRMITLPKRKRR